MKTFAQGYTVYAFRDNSRYGYIVWYDYLAYLCNSTVVCGGTHDTIYGRWLIVGEPKMSCLSDLIPFDIKFS